MLLVLSCGTCPHVSCLSWFKHHKSPLEWRVGLLHSSSWCIAALFVKRTVPFSNIDLCKVRVPGQLPENYLAGYRAGEASISKKLWLWCWSTRSKLWTSLDHNDKEMKIQAAGTCAGKGGLRVGDNPATGTSISVLEIFKPNQENEAPRSQPECSPMSCRIFHLPFWL